jgi:DNA-binding transcriptional LysR family regulator
MELRQLRYFVAVAEELHFRRAAERLYVAQPAVSEQIRKLEAEFGVRLFNRTNRRVELTDSGAALLVEARRLLAQAEATRRAAVNAVDVARTPLRLGYVEDALAASVPRALHLLTQESPEVTASIESGNAAQLIERVRNGELDVAVTGLPAPTGGLRVTSLGRQDAMAAIASTDRPRLSLTTSLAQLAPARLVALPRAINPASYDAVLSLCRDADVAPALVEVAEPRLEAALLAVAAGTGSAVLPSGVAERYAIAGVRFVALEEGSGAFEPAVLTRADTENRATAAFLRVLERCLRRTDAAAASGMRLAA